MSLRDRPAMPGELPGSLDEVAQALHDVRTAPPAVPKILDGPATINPANRNVVLRFLVRAPGPFTPAGPVYVQFGGRSPRRAVRLPRSLSLDPRGSS